MYAEKKKKKKEECLGDKSLGGKINWRSHEYAIRSEVFTPLDYYNIITVHASFKR